MPPFVLRLCQAMQAQDWQSVVLAPHAAGLKTEDNIEGIPCHRFRYAPPAWEQLAYGGGMLANVRAVKWRWLLLPFYLLAMLLSASRLLLQTDARVLHAHWIIPQGLVAAFLKRLFWWRRLRLVVTAHGGDFYARLPGAGWLMRWCMRQADVLAVVSHGMKRQAVAWGVPAERIVVASMGVDVQRFSPPETAARADIVFVGRLVEKKGVTHLLSAFARLRQEQPGLRLRIVGDGPLRPALEQQARAAGLEEAVTFLGARPPAEIPAVFQQAALFVMPSVVDSVGDQEGLGLVLAEAMACGCPVVAHDLDAVRDLVLPEETGLLVPQGDHAALAAAMQRLLGDEALCARLAATALQRVRALYAWPEVARRYRRIYDGAADQSVTSLSL